MMIIYATLSPTEREFQDILYLVHIFYIHIYLPRDLYN